MSDTYYIDLSQISLAQFQERLETQELLPGRRILQEHIATRFRALAGMGISNLQELHEALKTKKRLSQFAQESGLSLEYLTILRREVNSYRPSPVTLSAFPGVDEDCVARLTAVTIKNSRHLFNQTCTAGQQTDLSQQTGIGVETLHELIALSDLVRISGVGPVFARMLYDVGVKSSAALAEAQAAPLFSQLCDLNKAKTYTKAAFTERDMATCIELAYMLPKAAP
jgi:hypothetical protein